MKQDAFLYKIKLAVLAYDADALVVLYGSRARNEAKEDSDWDILILTSKKLDYKLENSLRDRIYDIEFEYVQPISTMIIDKESWNNWEVMPLHKMLPWKV